ncbi:MAG: DUF3783 domain-containing protein [Clostridia bacterium]|nr:DUF3783 domain-containing protein [Clostridia bacterium]
MNPKNPLVLCFGLNPKQASFLRVLCVKFGMQYVKAEEAKYAETIGVLAGLDVPTGAPLTDAHKLAEPMLVFCNLTTQEISNFLSEARRAKFSRPSLMAAFTDTNRYWTPAELQAQLSAERISVQQKMQSIHERSGHDHTHDHHHEQEENDHETSE